MSPTSAHPRPESARETPGWTATVFDEILCGLDGSEGSWAALQQATHLLGARRALRLVGLAGPGPDVERRRVAVEAQLERARSARRGRVHCSLEAGEPGRALVRAALEHGATLTVLAAAPYAWPGGTQTVDTVLRDAPGSVLVARPPLQEQQFPRVVVAGGLAWDAAGAVAAEVAHRFGAELRPLPADVDELVDASTSADVVVVTGPDAARIARSAYSSVLVVRERAAPAA